MLRKDDLMEGGQGSLDQDCKAVQNEQMSVHSKQSWTQEGKDGSHPSALTSIRSAPKACTKKDALLGSKKPKTQCDFLHTCTNLELICECLSSSTYSSDGMYQQLDLQ